MTDTRWTLDPAIDLSLETLELPPAPFMEQLMAERAPLEAAAPKVGEPAPSFAADLLSAEGIPTGEQAGLAHERDLALVFGSLTCPIYRGQIQRYNEIYAELKHRFAFLLIYIREAHPEDGWQVEINRTQNIVYDQPVTAAERAAIARTCVCEHAIEMPVAVDDMDDTINKLYSGSPERLYLIDTNGIVRHRSVPGPFKLDTIEAWHRALQGTL